jgi:ABC-type phosphate transport system auxiliary subunit
MDPDVITQLEISRLKKRRDQLLNTACTRFERKKILGEVKEINRRLRVLHQELGGPSTA